MPYSVLAPEQVPETGIQGPAVPTVAGEAVRHVARTGARVGEAIAGLPADILQGVSSLADIGQSYFTGKSSPLLRDIPYIPTSPRLREYVTTPVAEKIAGKGYIDPQTEKEALADEFAGDLSVFLLPIKGKIPFKRALATAGFGNMAKYGAKELGFSEGTQEAIKAGTMIGVNFAGPKRLKEIATNLYTKAESALAPGAAHSATKIQPVIIKLEHLMAKGDLPKNWDKKIKFLKDSIEGGKAPVQEIIDINKDINNLFYREKRPAAFARSFSGLKEGTEDYLKSYGKVNPAWYKNYSDANSLYSGIAKSKDVHDFLGKTLSGKNIGYGALGSLLGFYSLPTAMKGIAIGKGIAPIVETFSILGKNPIAWNYWMKTIQGAIAKNTRAVSHWATKLNKELEKESKSEQPKTSGYSVLAPA